MTEIGVIEIHKLRQYIGDVEVLNIPDLQIQQGESVCIQGSNGSGKTALLRLLTGLTQPTSGQVAVLGNDMKTIKSGALNRLRSDSIGFVFQHYRLIPYLSALDNMLLPCHFSAVRASGAETGSRSMTEDVFRLIRKLRLKDPSRLSKKATDYSAGQQQRFAIVRAVIGKPGLVLADEPASAMDQQGRQAVYQFLLEECRANGMTLLCTTHDDMDTEGFDRVIDMDALNQAREHELR
ncbi:ATP-binding cassette domain-containing protein [uncultured Endozoicomonas sp.]|uniref:ABC transporter ATP-binding protein n=1 Tax=uncultured Endozoicomonas sp. TaxID=432652 RepID=UPI00262B405B|nr:ATP-binding cassette domain-containing protein [uncultured Endozoicomonas sp.]